MRSSSYDQYAIIVADKAELFNKQLNEEIYRLRDNYPVVDILRAEPPFFATVKYRVTKDTPETIAEASAVEGVSFVCAQCPYFVPITKDDGTVDKRHKYGDCEHTELGRTLKMAPACDKLYELIKEGDVTVCFRD